MSSVKSVTGLLMFAKTESSYGAGATFAATDAIQVAQELPVFNQSYANDGNRNGAQWSGGNLQRTTPGGRSVAGTVMIELKGLGSGSSYAAATPPNLHPFMLASGFVGAVTSSTQYVYKPVPLGTQPSSVAINVYDRGELMPVLGGYCELSMTAEGAGITMMSFAVQGKTNDVTDVDVGSIPSRTYTAVSTLPPKNENVSFQIGSYTTAKVRNYSYTHGLQITPRANINETDGFAGFAIGRRGPAINVTIEADELSTFDAYADWKNATLRDVRLTIGTVSGNRVRVRFPTAQITSCERANEDPVAIWNLIITPAVSGPDNSDDVEWLWF